ncbi:DUF669 domain-containing protein [Eremococcus coleocola]|uniref:Putative phage prohead protease, HK97 family n=1 Tax=Eremococcus coleocola ACS-139-V-Col8 TaxID=908337 RepID=E4KQK0_9LACT|nr:DUF669 domain-containing protein [Eremococcus coleocola]EFR30706.1 putative phage prohead protease, HK97 family [Eremococcus coleocola ACS-139-V-Col8]
MSLKEVALETLNNYNPATDNPNSQGIIPAGEYDTVISKAGYRAYQSGYDAVALEFTVVGGDYDGRRELVNLNVDPEYPNNKKYPSFLTKNIKLISQLAFAADFNLDDDDWEDQMTLGDVIGEKAMGAQMVLEITESENKNKPESPYRNYQFLKYADDLPFD